MIGHEPSAWWRITWKILAPMCMLVLFYSIYSHKPLSSDPKYPLWSETFGCLLILSSMLYIPCYFIYKYFKETGTFDERIG